MRALLCAEDPGEVRLHLELLGLAGGAGRSAVLAAVRSGAAPVSAEDRLLHALEHVGWQGVPRALERIVGDRGAPREARELALRLLAARDLEDGLELADEDGLALASELLSGVYPLGDGGRALVEFLEVSPEEVRGATVVLVEEARRAERIPASMVWGAAVAVEWIATLHPPVVDALVAEGSAEAEAALERARDDAAERHRSALDAALFRLRTARIDRAPLDEDTVPGLEAWVTVGDAVGAYQILLKWGTRPGRATLLGVLLHANAGVRDGGMFSDLDPFDCDELLDELSELEGQPAAPIAPELALTLLDDALDRCGGVMPSDVEPIVRIARGLTRRRLPRVAPEAGRLPDGRALRALLSEPPLASWHCDAADLRAVALPPPRRGAPAAALRAWAVEAAGRARGTAMHPRLVAAAEFQAWWWSVFGDEARAGALAALAEQLRDLPERSELLVHLLERGARLPRPTSAKVAFGDDALRALLRASLPSPPSRPRGVDVARLDLAEAAMSALEQAFARVDAAVRPRPADAVGLAFELASRAVEEVRGQGTVAGVEPWLRERVEADGHAPADAVEVAAVTVRGLDWFLGSVCKRCPTACWSRPTRPMARVWRSPIHPAWG